MLSLSYDDLYVKEKKHKARPLAASYSNHRLLTNYSQIILHMLHYAAIVPHSGFTKCA